MTEDVFLPLPAPRIAPTAPALADEASVAAAGIAALVENHATTLFRVAHAILRNRAEAEDTVQDTFVRVLENRTRLSTIRDHRVWLIRITWNLALDRRRRLRPAQMDDVFIASLVAAHIPQDTALEHAERIAAVLRAIDALPGAERQALLLSTVEELDAATIATIMDKSASAVRALIFRARTHLRTRLEKGGHA